MNQTEPLAYRMRPKTLEEYVGQEHVLGEGKLLYRGYDINDLVKGGVESNFIFEEAAYLLLFG